MRLDIPSEFEEQIILLNQINTKVAVDKTASPILQMMLKKGINLTNDIATGVKASSSQTDFLANTLLGEQMREKRDIIMSPVKKDISNSFQVLKEHFKPEFKSVGDWGANISTTGKITYATTTQGEANTLALLKKQNDSYVSPAISPLASYLSEQEIDLTVDTTNAATGLGYDKSMHTAKIAAEVSRENRDILWSPVLKHIHEIGTYLMKIYNGNATKVGFYGFVVVAIPKVIKARKISIAFTQSKLNIKVAIGSLIINTGTETVNIYKGAVINGTPVELAPGKKWIVIAGYSILSIENTSIINFADFGITPPIV